MKRFWVLIVMVLLICRPVAVKPFEIIDEDLLVDQGGRKIRIKKPFGAIISLYGAHTENLFSLGLDTEIIGVTRHEDFPPQALQKPTFSYHDDPEKFLGARPDLVLIRPMIDRGYPQLVHRLEKSGIVVVSLQPGTVEDMYRYWQALGMLTGRHGRAIDMIARFRGAVEAFTSLAPLADRRKRVYFESIHGKMKTFSRDSMAIFALGTAGGINIAPDAIPSRGTNVANYGKERILSHAKGIDVYLAQVGTMNQVTISDINTESGFRAIRAVRNGEVYLVDERIVSRPTFRMLDGIYAIGKILYPDIYRDGAHRILENAGYP